MNTQVFDDAIGYIEAHPEEWNQGNWFYRKLREYTEDGYPTDCGTACCLAGTVAMQAGYRPFYWSRWDSTTSTVVQNSDDEPQDVSEIAADLLEIPYEDATVLFRGHNTLENIKTIGKDIVNDELKICYVDGCACGM